MFLNYAGKVNLRKGTEVVFLKVTHGDVEINVVTEAQGLL